MRRLLLLMAAVALATPALAQFRPNPTWTTTPLPVVAVTSKGAACDGRRADDAAFAAALAAVSSTGGEIVIPNRRCRLTQAWVLNVPNVTVRGTGEASEVYLDAAGGSFPYDRAIQVTGTWGSDYAVTSGPIAVGATTFTSATTTGLVAGDWIQVAEYDATIGDVAYFDVLQIASVAGNTVTVVQPFRTAFPNYATINYRKMVGTASGVVLRDFAITTSQTGGASQIALNVQMARGVRIEGVRVDSGKGFALYRCAAVTLTKNRQVRSSKQTTEFASCVDLTVTDNVFDSDNLTGGVQLNLGTAWFSFTGNKVYGANCGIGLYYGVHDGAVSGNVVAYVPVNGQASATGLTARGTQRVTYTGNAFGGAYGPQSKGITLGDGTAMAHPVVSTGNVVALNTVSGFALPNEAGAGDYLAPTSSAPPLPTWPYAPAITELGTEVTHVTFNGTGLVDTKAAGWVQVGTVPQIFPAGAIPPAAGPFATSAYYSLPSGAPLNFAGDWSACVAFYPTSLTGSQYLASSGATDVNGWSLQVGASNVYFVISRLGGHNGLATANAPIVNAVNVACFGRASGNMLVQLNGGTVASQAIGWTPAAGTSATLGSFGAVNPVKGWITEAWFTTSTAAAGVFSPAMTAVHTRYGVTAW